jgi:hypothetical protein
MVPNCFKQNNPSKHFFISLDETVNDSEIAVKDMKIANFGCFLCKLAVTKGASSKLIHHNKINSDEAFQGKPLGVKTLIVLHWFLNSQTQIPQVFLEPKYIAK